MRIAYPTPAALAAHLAPYVEMSRLSALGCVLPPGYAAGWLERSPRALRFLAALERRLAGRPAFAAMADHYLFEARNATVPFVPSLLESPPRRLWRSLAKRLVDLGYLVTGRRRYDDYRIETVAGLRLLVLPSVSNPKVLRTGEFFARQLAALHIDEHTSVLDLGTGSGICALQAARRARAVVAVDINEAAVRCARINAAINQLEHRVEVRCGDLFAPVHGSRFDLVLFNPPFCNGAPRDAREAAWRSADLPLRFARELDTHLAPGGEALLLLSSWGDACPRFERELRRQGFRMSVFAVHRHINEIVTLLRVRRP
jgi:HemK-related putative methylase